jgi:replication factor C subunit 1
MDNCRKVTTAVSSRTSYLIVGRDPGESKTKKATEMKTKVIDENGFFNLLETSEEKAEIIDTKAKTATQKQMEKMDKEAVGSIQSPTAGMKEGDTQTLLWTDKWKPTKYSEICGNAGLVKKIATWLREW